MKLLYLKLGAYVLIPIVLLILPATQFDEGPPLCLSVLLFDRECYGCGLTRATQHLIHFEFVDAFYYNPMVFVVFPLLVFLWAKWAWSDWQKLRSIQQNAAHH